MKVAVPFLCVIGTVIAQSGMFQCGGQARYEARVTSSWTQTSSGRGAGIIPSDGRASFDPSSEAHFTHIVGTTHNNQFDSWDVGQLATNGLERLAEVGDATALAAELSRLPNTGTAIGPGADITLPSGSSSISFSVSGAFSQASFGSMLTPSPDWYWMVKADMCDHATGQWKQQFDMRPTVYDAGTDSGRTFQSPDMDIARHQPITVQPDFAMGTPVGNVRFQLLPQGGTGSSNSMMISNSNRFGRTSSTSSSNPMVIDNNPFGRTRIPNNSPFGLAGMSRNPRNPRTSMSTSTNEGSRPHNPSGNRVSSVNRSSNLFGRTSRRNPSPRLAAAVELIKRRSSGYGYGAYTGSGYGSYGYGSGNYGHNYGRPYLGDMFGQQYGRSHFG